MVCSNNCLISRVEYVYCLVARNYTVQVCLSLRTCSPAEKSQASRISYVLRPFLRQRFLLYININCKTQCTNFRLLLHLSISLRDIHKCVLHHVGTVHDSCSWSRLWPVLVVWFPVECKDIRSSKPCKVNQFTRGRLGSYLAQRLARPTPVGKLTYASITM